MRARAPGFRHGVERATKWYNESLDTERGSTSRASGVAGVEAAREPTSQLLCGGTGSGASGQSGSAKASTTPAYGGDGESRPRDSRGETGIPRIYPLGGSQLRWTGVLAIDEEALSGKVSALRAQLRQPARVGNSPAPPTPLTARRRPCWFSGARTPTAVSRRLGTGPRATLSDLRGGSPLSGLPLS